MCFNMLCQDASYMPRAFGVEQNITHFVNLERHDMSQYIHFWKTNLIEEEWHVKYNACNAE